jgi:hypothetical protein
VFCILSHDVAQPLTSLLVQALALVNTLWMNTLLNTLVNALANTLVNTLVDILVNTPVNTLMDTQVNAHANDALMYILVNILVDTRFYVLVMAIWVSCLGSRAGVIVHEFGSSVQMSSRAVLLTTATGSTRCLWACFIKTIFYQDALIISSAIGHL